MLLNALGATNKTNEFKSSFQKIRGDGCLSLLENISALPDFCKTCSTALDNESQEVGCNPQITGNIISQFKSTWLFHTKLKLSNKIGGIPGVLPLICLF